MIELHDRPTPQPDPRGHSARLRYAAPEHRAADEPRSADGRVRSVTGGAVAGLALVLIVAIALSVIGLVAALIITEDPADPTRTTGTIESQPAEEIAPDLDAEPVVTQLLPVGGRD